MKDSNHKKETFLLTALAMHSQYAKQYAEGTSIVVLEPDVAKVFSDSATVNQALRQLIEQRSR